MRLIRWGDGFSILVFVSFAAACTYWFWNPDMAENLVIRASGKVFRTVNLLHNQSIAVPGPLGVTIVQVKDGHARIAKDPSPRQYCVRQGWLSQAGQIAICLPNQTSIELTGSHQAYDSLSF